MKIEKLAGDGLKLLKVKESSENSHLRITFMQELGEYYYLVSNYQKAEHY